MSEFNIETLRELAALGGGITKESWYMAWAADEIESLRKERITPPADSGQEAKGYEQRLWEAENILRRYPEGWKDYCLASPPAREGKWQQLILETFSELLTVVKQHKGFTEKGLITKAETLIKMQAPSTAPEAGDK